MWFRTERIDLGEKRGVKVAPINVLYGSLTRGASSADSLEEILGSLRRHERFWRAGEKRWIRPGRRSASAMVPAACTALRCVSNHGVSGGEKNKSGWLPSDLDWLAWGQGSASGCCGERCWHHHFKGQICLPFSGSSNAGAVTAIQWTSFMGVGLTGLRIPWLSWIHLERGSPHRCQRQELLCVRQSRWL